ncbi:hypothetical protein ACH5A2_32490 [Streptomyces collinus]|uniref:hypothetical protein n=1 Tax=Streptomyces collinus TaxID=42684 RepID=UPI0037A01BD5
MAELSLASTAISAAVGAFTALLGAGWKNYLDSRRKIDEDLRERRDKAYTRLWPTIMDFSQQDDGPSYSGTRQFRRDLANWYYQDGGGLYLSRGSQKSLKALFKVIDEMLVKQKGEDGEPLPDESSKKADEKVQALRASLTGDLLSYRSGRNIV